MSAERKTETIPQWKREEVADIVETIEAYDSVGVVNIAGIPSRQLQSMRKGLHGTAELRVSRNTLVVRALEEGDEGLEALTDYVSGQVGLVATDATPFALYRELEASKTPAPINAGEGAPNDIVIPEGDTGIDPGPFVGELQSVGANARIDAGSIQVLEDSTVLEAGGEVSADLANVLTELGIEPKEVGLDLHAVFSDGVVFEPDELALDIGEYRREVETAAARSRNLSVNAAYPTAQTAGALLGKAHGEATSLGLQAAIEDPAFVDDLVSKADSQVRALAARVDDDEALPEGLRDVDAPTAEPTDDQDETEDATGDADEVDADADGDSDADEEDVEDEDDDEDDDGGDALGAMFG